MTLIVALLRAFASYLLIAFLPGFLWQTLSSGKAVFYQRQSNSIGYWSLNAMAEALLTASAIYIIAENLIQVLVLQNGNTI